MKKIRAAVVGYGNIGRFALQALEAADDFEVAGIVRRHGAENKPQELARYDVVSDIRELKDVDVAILATPTRSCEEYAQQILPLGINTVDSFDIHTEISGYRQRMDELCKKTGRVSVIAAGWDPGSDSVVRTLIESLLPVPHTPCGDGCLRRGESSRRALPLRLLSSGRRRCVPSTCPVRNWCMTDLSAQGSQ